VCVNVFLIGKMENITTRKFKLQDRLYQLGFSRGLLESTRQKQISAFIEKYENDLDRLEAWITCLEERDEGIKNKGGFLRKAMREDWKL